MRLPAATLVTPGLRKRSGVYACAVGIFKPIVLVDPVIFGICGEQALVAHELEHVRSRHALQALLVAVAAVGTFVGALMALYEDVTHYSGWLALSVSLFWAYFYCWVRRNAEIEADAAALQATTPREFSGLVFMHPHPTSGWGRWLYGNTPEARVFRVLPL